MTNPTTSTTSPSDKSIPWFNPREMDDATLVALATGRETLLNEFLLTVERRRKGVEHGLTGEHWLVTGTRGAGKSYFLRYAQIRTSQRFAPSDVRFVLLPEELRNLRAPNDLLDEIKRLLSPTGGNPGRAAQWRTEEPEAQWRQSLHGLMTELDSLSTPLLVVGIENFAEVLDRAFKDDVAASLLRQLMEHEPRILFLASAVDGSFDEQYRQRLFLQFSQHPLPTWDAQAHRDYLTQRARLIGQIPSPKQLARIDAYSRYTGGNARIAAILAAAILDENDMTRTSADLNATLDKMSDYYRAQLDKMPPNTEALFDALVRDGEPCSQTQLAERVGARQNDISRAFHWLLDGGYLLAKRPTGQKEIHYQVADRLFVQWYRMRYITPGQLSRLAVLAELLADTLAFEEKWSFAQSLAQQGEQNDAQLMAELGFKEIRIDVNKLKAQGASLETLLQWGERLTKVPVRTKNDTPEDKKEKPIAFVHLDLLEKFSSDALMRQEFTTALTIAKCSDGFNGMVSGERLTELCLGSLSLSPSTKLQVIQQLPRFQLDQWKEMTETFEDEIVEFRKLMPTEGEIIKGLKKKSELGMDYPWMISWLNCHTNHVLFVNNEDQYSETDRELMQTFSGGIYCLYATAEPSDALAQHANGVWIELSKSLPKLINQRGTTSLVLDFLNALIEAGNSQFTPQQLAVLCDNGSLAASTIFENKQQLCLALAQQAVACFKAKPKTSDAIDNRSEHAFALARLGWAWGQQNDWQQALACHQKAIDLLPADSRNTGWDIGQTARYLWHVEGFDAAWAFIAAHPWLDESAPLIAIRQLGDRVVDEQRVAGEAPAYALARQLLERVLQQTLCPPVEAVRALFIDMLSEGLSLTTLRDLAQDLAKNPALGSLQNRMTSDEVAPGAQDRQAEEITALGQTLSAWIADLQARRPAAPGAPAQTLPDAPTDPDWLMTLEALNKALPMSTRIRLGLEPAPQLSPNASRVFQKMMGFIHRFRPPTVAAP